MSEGCCWIGRLHGLLWRHSSRPPGKAQSVPNSIHVCAFLPSRASSGKDEPASECVGAVRALVGNLAGQRRCEGPARGRKSGRQCRSAKRRASLPAWRGRTRRVCQSVYACMHVCMESRELDGDQGLHTHKTHRPRRDHTASSRSGDLALARASCNAEGWPLSMHACMGLISANELELARAEPSERMRMASVGSRPPGLESQPLPHAEAQRY